MIIKICELDNGLGFLMKVNGIYTNKQFYAALKETLYEFLEKKNEYIYFISDFSSLKINDFNMTYIQKIADLYLEVVHINKDLVIAVTVQDEKTYGLADMWVTAVEDSGWDIALFKERSHSDYWLHSTMKKKYDLSNLTYSE